MTAPRIPDDPRASYTPDWRKPSSATSAPRDALAMLFAPPGGAALGGASWFDPNAPRRFQIERAQREMAANSITDSQRGGYQGRISDILYHDIAPNDYGAGAGLDNPGIARAVRDFVTLQRPSGAPARGSGEFDGGANDPYAAQRNDSWRMYLGLPQEHRTFGVSDYMPSNDTTEQPYYKLNDYRRVLLGSDEQSRPVSGVSRTFDELVRETQTAKGRGQTSREGDQSGVLGNYKLDLGQDTRGPYLSYYDIWDLKHPAARVIGKPYEVYDRIYYDPKTLQPLNPQPTAHSTHVTDADHALAASDPGYAAWLKARGHLP